MKHHHVEFIEAPVDARNRTRKWWVRSKANGNHLGQVRWWTSWRRYTFVPHHSSLFDADCLWDIADFLAKETANRKEARAEEKKHG